MKKKYTVAVPQTGKVCGSFSDQAEALALAEEMAKAENAGALILHTVYDGGRMTEAHTSIVDADGAWRRIN